jgi:hypothetical protein
VLSLAGPLSAVANDPSLALMQLAVAAVLIPGLAATASAPTVRRRRPTS